MPVKEDRLREVGEAASVCREEAPRILLLTGLGTVEKAAASPLALLWFDYEARKISFNKRKEIKLLLRLYKYILVEKLRPVES